MNSGGLMLAGLLMAAIAAAGCDSGSGGDDDDDVSAGADAAVSSIADASPSVDAPDALTIPPQADAAPDQADAAPGTMATLSGTITRSTEPQHGGVGNIYIAVFANNPVSDMTQTPVGQALVEDADMTAGDASVDYSVPGLPPRGDAYFVVAFLDDNDTVDATDPAAAGPDTGDLMSMDGFAAPTVMIDSAGTTVLDLDLNFAYPF